MAIKPPPCEWKHLKNADLSKLRTKFIIPDFQRELSSKHSGRCLQAILSNDFYDNVIQCGELANGNYEVYNGQHRIAALWRAHREYGLMHYNLVLQIFPKGIGRRVFYRNNLGKPLTMTDRTKTFDDHKTRFFNSLREFLNHHVGQTRTSYANMMNAMRFAKTGSPRAIAADRMEQFLKEITKTEINMCQQFLTAMMEVSPHVPQSNVFRMPMFRSLFRVGYENDFDLAKWRTFIRACNDSEKLQEFWKTGSSHTNVMSAYEYMVDSIAPTIQLAVKQVSHITSRTEDGSGF